MALREPVVLELDTERQKKPLRIVGQKKSKRPARKAVPVVQWTFLAPKDMDRVAREAFAEVERERAARKLPRIEFSHFMLYGIVTDGLRAFYAAKEKHEAESRLVVTPAEAAAQAAEQRYLQGRNQNARLLQ